MADKKQLYRAVAAGVKFSQEEEKILDHWDQEKIFERTLEESKEKPLYSFYDGPPFATGLPHYGHILAGLLKDVVPRYWTMRGYHIPRYFGWDCHGVPVEYEINKAKNITSSAQVLDMGVAEYNEACRSIVDRYTSEWKKTVRRTGRWVDMDNCYRTMDLEFMQSVWWVFKQLWDKGLIYEGYKVVPYSIGISTPLSNFEASQNYKDVQDPAVTLRFKLDDNSLRELVAKKKLIEGGILDLMKFKTHGVSLLAWTTTPWTLPSNLGLAVGSDLDYELIQINSTEEIVILGKDLIPSFHKELGGQEGYGVLGSFKGSELIGLTYEPLFDYFKELKVQKAFTVISSTHVTTDAGTGIVHMAPAFGEEDFYACKEAGLPIVNPVDDDGKFTKDVPDWSGVMVKDADKDIIKALKDQELLFKHDTLVHSYPHCERTDTPLIYKAVSSWFVSVESFRDKIVANNAKTNWVPDNIRDGRFGNWLKNARDWAISRNRFWGTPLPVWRNDEGEVICIGSAKELSDLTGEEVTDLHIHFVDHLEIPSKKGGAPLKRISGVLDCWFESGSMPYAQWGYPYNESMKENFEKGFPAEFIAEGLDQTRGWFYTLMVIATALFDEPAFKNVIVNGMVLAEDGKKMSKRLKNYPDPNEVMDKYGADALRLTLIDSPVVRAQELRFSEKRVEEVVRRILLRWWNAYSFFVSYASIDEFSPKGDFEKSPNILDQWILSRLNSLKLHTNQEMEAYRLYNVVPALVQFIEELTNTYIRFNRRHFWQEGMPEDKRLAYETLYHVLMELSRLMAPFTPFISENIFQNLKGVSEGSKDSVHLESYPAGDESKSNTQLEADVSHMEELCLMGRNLREKMKVKAKIPLKKLTIIMRDQTALDSLKQLEPYFQDELNAREIVYENNEDKYVNIHAKANFKVLGQKLGKKMKPVAAGIGELTIDDLLRLERGEVLTIEGESITSNEVEIRRDPKEKSDHFLTGRDLSLDFDPSVDKDQLQEGLAREVIRRVQMGRKNANFQLDDRIRLELQCVGELKEAVEAFTETIQRETLSKEFSFSQSPTGEYTEKFDIDGSDLQVGLKRL